jgi:hypothetical protein
MSQRIIWEDVTPLFSSACSQLDDKNPMVESADFSLRESMSAIELMDPKMDQCLGVTGDVDTVTLLKIDLNRDIQLIQVEKLFAVLINFEVSHLLGASILDSTHLCKLLWPESWEPFACNRTDLLSRVVLIYVKLLYFTLSCYHKTHISGDIFEEEDFLIVPKPALNHTLVDLQSLAPEFDQIISDLTAKKQDELAFVIDALQLRWALASSAVSIDTFVSILMAFKKTFREATVETLPAMADMHKQIGEKLASLTDALKSLTQSAMNSKVLEVTAQNDQPEITVFFAEKLAQLTQPSFIRTVTVKSLQESLKTMDSIVKHLNDVVDASTSWFNLSGLQGDGTESSLSFDYILSTCIDFREKIFHLTRVRSCGLLFSCIVRYQH